MPRKGPLDPPQVDLDWREFVDEMRTKRMQRERTRPSDLLRRQSMRWRDPKFDRKRDYWLGSAWLDKQELEQRAAARANLLERMMGPSRKD